MKTYPVRTAAKAILIADGGLLVVKHRRGQEFYTLPGGGQNHNEPLATTLVRECLEETGIRVVVGELVFVRDYIAGNHEFAAEDAGFHQLDLMFACERAHSDAVENSTRPDDFQIGVEWLPIERLEEFPLYPLSIRKHIKSHYRRESTPVYLGDIN